MPVDRFPFPRPRPARKMPPDSILDRMTDERFRRAELASWSYQRHVLRWMNRCALRAIRLGMVTAGRPPTLESLTEWIECITYADGNDWLVHPYDEKAGPHRISTEVIPELAAKAASLALEIFDADHHARMSAWGKKSRRPPTWTLKDLDALGPGLTVPQIMDRLGCGRTKAKELLREARARDAERFDPSLDDELNRLLEFDPPEITGPTPEPRQPTSDDLLS